MGNVGVRLEVKHFISFLREGRGAGSRFSVTPAPPVPPSHLDRDSASRSPRVPCYIFGEANPTVLMHALEVRPVFTV